MITHNIKAIHRLMYYYGARLYDPVTGLFTSIDPLCERYYHVNPYVYCMGNPVRYVDPDGREVVIVGPLANMALQQLQSYVGDKIQLSLTSNNYLCYDIVKNKSLNKASRSIIKMIDDSNITIKMATTEKIYISTGSLFVGGAFMGNNVETDLVGNVIGTTAFQEVNPQVLEKADAYSKKGTFMMHELTEAYEGAVISANKKTSSPNSSEAGTVYRKAHDKATYQPPVGVRCYESEGNVTSKLQEAKRVEWFVVSPNNSKNEKTIQTLP